jgi:hypothetical protein
MRRRLFFRSAFAFAVALASLPASADQLSLSMQNGRVTLVAENVTVRQILAEWARVGQTRIVNGERVPGAPVTLRLDNVPEAAALQTLLRNVSGYLAAPRPGNIATASVFDRIMILPTSSAPASMAGAAPRGAAPNVPVPQPAVPVPVPADDDTEDRAEEAAPNTPFVPFNAPRPQEFENANPNAPTPMAGPRRGFGPLPQQPAQAPAQPPLVPQPYVTAPTGVARPGEMLQPAAGAVPGMPAGTVPGVQRPAQPTTPPPPQD